MTWIKAAAAAVEIVGDMFNHRLAREIAVIVAVKMAIIVAAGLFVFGPERLHVTSSAIEAHLFGSVLESGR